MTTETLNIFSGWIQLGFAGFCLILVLAIGWLLQKLLQVVDNTNNVLSSLKSSIDQNTTAHLHSSERLYDSLDVIREQGRKHQERLDDLYKTCLQNRCVVQRDRPRRLDEE